MTPGGLLTTEMSSVDRQEEVSALSVKLLGTPEEKKE